MPLVVPVRASHVNAAYAEARSDPDGLIHREIQWLRDFHPSLGRIIEGTFDRYMRCGDRNLAAPYALGSSIGHLSVRHCTDETGDYDAARIAFLHNLRIGQTMPEEASPWNTQPSLDGVFGDREITDALLGIRHDVTRAAAASMLGYLCLDEIPNAPVLGLAPC